jgi:predicted aconitase with swiveling domain
MFGVSFGLSWNRRAAAPAAIGVETEVPLILITFIVALVPLLDSFNVGF